MAQIQGREDKMAEIGESFDALTVKEVAARYRVSNRSVRNWLRSGKLKGFRAGPTGEWRILSTEVARFEGSHE